MNQATENGALDVKSPFRGRSRNGTSTEERIKGCDLVAVHVVSNLEAECFVSEVLASPNASFDPGCALQISWRRSTDGDVDDISFTPPPKSGDRLHRSRYPTVHRCPYASNPTCKKDDAIEGSR